MSMQVRAKYYDKGLHDRYRAVSIVQPYADMLAQGIRGAFLMSEGSNYRGDVLICSAATPDVFGRHCGTLIATANVYDVREARSLTAANWDAIGAADRERTPEGFVYFVRNVRRVVELPVRWQGRGLWTYVCPRGEITEYPREVELDKAAYDLIMDIQNDIRRA